MKRLMNSLVFVLWISNNSALNAYDPATHREIAQQATAPTISSIDQVLKNELGLLEGIRVTFPGISEAGLRSVQQLIGDGARSEDVPDQRSLNHFHNPLVAWEGAGLRTFSVPGVPLIRGQSSVLWQQNTNQNFSFVFTPLPVPSLGGNWSWQDARRYYLNALTRPRREDITREDGQIEPGRETAFAEMFEALGHLAHLLQDATVPAHVRNDPHPPFLRNPDWYEDWVTETRTERPDVFQGLLNTYNKDLHRPPFSIFTPTGDTLAPVPIARLMDTDKFLGFNFSVLSDPELGIIEYTNGNYLSRDTIFRDFVLPRQASLAPDFIVEPVGQKFRRYRSKLSEGEGVTHFVAEGLLHNSLQEALGAEPVPAGGWTLDDRVNQAYAEKLLPRAVGYSAALLDYFLRGKLDVDLVINSENPTTAKLSGTYETTNGSLDSLVIGNLELYADPPDGTRFQVPALDSTVISGVNPGDEIPSPTYEISEEAERFVAVYKGTLGNEIRDEADNFPGGVIGKVLGGVRVEEIFNDGSQWHLRTPKGVFPLPIFTDQVRVLKWGDADNTLVGRSTFDISNPTGESSNRFFVYRLNRPEGSAEVPLREVDGVQIVDLEQIREARFPFGNVLVTTVDFTGTIHFQQHLLSLVVTTIQTWDGRRYQITDTNIFDGQVDSQFEQAQSIHQPYPIILDGTDRTSGPPRYVWDLQDFGLSADGRILAQVRVLLISPREEATFRFFSITPNLLPAQVIEVDPITLPFSFPDLMRIFALADVDTGELVASTAPANLIINHESSHVGYGFPDGSLSATVFSRSERIGGPRNGEVILFSFGSRPVGHLCSIKGQEDQMVELGEVSIETGTLEASVDQYRPEIAALAFPPEFGGFDSANRFIFRCPTETKPPGGFKVNSTTQGFEVRNPFQVVRPRPGSTPEELLLLFNNGEELFRLVRWIPGSNSAEISHETEREEFEILGASNDAAMIRLEEFSDDILRRLVALVSIRGESSPIEFPLPEESEDFGLFFVLLNPRFLYNLDDLKFYNFKPSLQKTLLPARLREFQGNRFLADYHVVRVP